MGRNVYRFGDYTLDPASRELRHRGEHVALPPKSFDCLVYLIENRERAIGRDELISAVWGRVDASDAVVSQTLLRARRAIGDTGTEQSAVRTVTRFGYQWVAPVESLPQEVEADARDPGVQEAAVDDGDDPATPAASEGVERPADASDARSDQPVSTKPRARRWRWGIAAIAIASIIVALLAVGLWRHSRKPPPSTGVADLAVVLPVVVESGGAEHAWIRLGAMDYIASLLRRNGRLTVLPSERTLVLVDAEHAIAPEAIDHLHAVTRARWVLQPVASTVPQGWKVRIRVSAPGDSYDIEARGGTPLEAAAAATGSLLHRLGHDGPAAPAPTALTQRLQQVDAELLAGQTDAARNLIDAAPARQRADPQLQVREGQLEFRLGRLGAAQILFDRIVDAATTLPVEVRSQALMGLGAVALRRQDNAASERRYDEAVQALEAHADAAPDPALVGNAYNGRGVARVELGRIDDGIADLGRARIAMQRSGDEVEAASVGGNIGTLKARNGDAAQAIQEFDLAIATFERFDVRDSLVVMLLAKSDAELQLLQPTAALGDSQRAMELGSKLENPQLRAFMAATRTGALLGNGRLQDAEGLLRQGQDASPALRLQLLLERGRLQDAHKLAQDLLLQDAAVNDPGTLLLAVQAAIDGKDPALARQWLQSRAGNGDGGNHDAIDLAGALLAAATGDQVTAARSFDAAAKAAARTPAPADDARAGSAWVAYLVGRGELDRASGVMGSLTPYVDRDYRVARASLALYRALGDRALQAEAETRVRRLAGERNPDSPVVY
ncbi:hypothetical protein FNZ56_06795 [Pseudoluteimonas lycopersici]|uniref:OmpR/PhoB-type domain-containing protein n=1 Tax=Pseudoluteimonas lycopersici TaxID=1324796 RepID=A0A516V4Y8_9GAMM|nr:transcriptional regulator [Lysobacter lycopersici]QDQ73600.1 hypothetical protein FNZ56_06795 [Lysobacter lycopersici]